MDVDSCPNFLKPKLRIFLSVDLVGSTRFKQEARTDDVFPPWLGVVTNFYREFDRLFREEWEHTSNKYNEPRFRFGDKPEFWKAVGDELLYSKVLTHYTEALSCLHVWISAVRRYRRALEEKEHQPPLSVKTTAWLGGFPVINTEVIVAAPGVTESTSQRGADPLYDNMRLVDEWYRNKAEGKPPIGLLDFVGPNIDVGFRLTGQSTDKRMAISVDLSLMIVMAQFGNRAWPHAPLKMYYSGGTSLKGVMSSDPYPWFWIDVRDDGRKDQFEDALFSTDPNKILEFSESFLERHSKTVDRPLYIRPYIEHEDEDQFKTQPASHAAVREQLLNFWIENQESCCLDSGSTPGNDAPTVVDDSKFMAVVNDLLSDQS